MLTKQDPFLNSDYRERICEERKRKTVLQLLSFQNCRRPQLSRQTMNKVNKKFLISSAETRVEIKETQQIHLAGSFQFINTFQFQPIKEFFLSNCLLDNLALFTIWPQKTALVSHVDSVVIAFLKSLCKFPKLGANLVWGDKSTFSALWEK